MKITVFNGSPRGGRSNSHRIVAPLLEGAAQAGARTEEVFLADRDIRHCLGCFACWEKTPGTCALRDDMAELMALYLESDLVGMATPVYNAYMTGLLKNFTDRLLPLAMPHIQKNEDGSFYHEGRVRRLPRQFFVANSGFPGAHNFGLLQAIIGRQEFVLEIYRNCGEALQVTPDDPPRLRENIARFQEALRKAGRELAGNGWVSEETRAQIHMEIISDDEYMAQGNQYWDEAIRASEPGGTP